LAPIRSFENFGADFLNDACDLVSQRERQGHAARGIKPLAAAEVGVTVLDMQIGVGTARSARCGPGLSLPCGFGVSKRWFHTKAIEFDP